MSSEQQVIQTYIEDITQVISGVSEGRGERCGVALTAMFEMRQAIHLASAAAHASHDGLDDLADKLLLAHGQAVGAITSKLLQLLISQKDMNELDPIADQMVSSWLLASQGSGQVGAIRAAASAADQPGASAP